MTTREFDLIVYGATGFTGRQCVDYVARRAPPGLRWAIAGRSVEKLRRVRRGLGAAGQSVPMIVADAHDDVAVGALVAKTRVLLTTAGPYAKYGSLLFGACAAAGTDYVDITGETPWVRLMIDQHHETARESGARMVPFCGFDSVPSELGVAMLVDHFRSLGETTREVRSAFKARGGFNGGTLDSAVTMMESGQVRQLADPFLLNPPESRPGTGGARSEDVRTVERDEALGTWTAPFFMGPVNTRVVRRSQALWAAQGRDHGPDFAYRETLAVGSRLQGQLMLGAIGASTWLGARSWGRRLIRALSPAPGEGPSEATMDGGGFTARFVGVSESGRTALATIKGQGDPGNRCTVRMLCEAAFCLVDNDPALPAHLHGGGVLTPATALGAVLQERLRATGEMRFSLQPGPVGSAGGPPPSTAAPADAPQEG